MKNACGHACRGRFSSACRGQIRLTVIEIAAYNFASFGSLAQLVEQRTFNPLVAGSNPARPTKEFKGLQVQACNPLSFVRFLCRGRALISSLDEWTAPARGLNPAEEPTPR
ncbi:hypothetical protein BURKHO8Y_210442 [Burkholderia sp. 8Y]|nr:hypothetical protein BURKHO8Y_210442 [Burkholderia sp. 8Y]